jgi:hypothetical protein
MMARLVYGVSDGTLITAVQPVAMTGATLRAIIAAGKFHLYVSLCLLQLKAADSRNKQGANTDRLLDNNIPSSINRTRNNLSITPNSLPSEPVDITSSISSFSNSIIPRFPILPNDQSCDILQVLLEEIMHFSQVALSLGWGSVAESLEGLVGYFDCFSGILEGHFRACSDDFSCCWVCPSAMSPLERVGG